MPNKLIFRAETLTPVIQDVTKNACELWFMADDGIYLTASTATFIRKKRNICYAEGFDPDLWDDAGAHFDAIDLVLGNGDMWESVTLAPEMLDDLMTGTADLTIEVTDSGFICTARQREADKTA
ncbi:DUF3085 domain-containing protein [Ewingella americana]|uniref:DUF3085 domain-containing protein n=1 Tax=Ewingella americana TaxID=41202 RepID=A0A502G4X0_9GAMM|nr:DUF3085 domain-containing protein [Ewingella americana]TPG56844.1 DUF3085 domain-containing protein [Ewingella americana]